MPESRIQRKLVELDVDGGERVPGILQAPDDEAPAPAVLLLHGFTSHKEDMADSLGRALLRRGIASLAIDLPLHGKRVGNARELSFREPLSLVRSWRLALREAQEGILYLTRHPAVDPERVAIAGYSLGSYLSIIAAAAEPRIRAVALTAGGDLPADTPFAAIVRTIADPRRAAQSLGGRPLLMMNGTRDRTIPPDQANALFTAAREPKEQRWYDGPHWPPTSAVNEVAEWLASRLAARPSGQSSPRAGPAGSSRSPRPHKAS